MKEIKDYLAYQGEQYRNPEKAGAELALSQRDPAQLARAGLHHPQPDRIRRPCPAAQLRGCKTLAGRPAAQRHAQRLPACCY